MGVRGAKNPWRKRLLPGLAARVYLVCAGQLVAVACALYVLSNYAFDSHARGDFARFARPALEESLDAAAVRSPERLGALARELGARLVVLDALGRVLREVAPPDAPPLPAPSLERGRGSCANGGGLRPRGFPGPRHGGPGRHFGHGGPAGPGGRFGGPPTGASFGAFLTGQRARFTPVIAVPLRGVAPDADAAEPRCVLVAPTVPPPARRLWIVLLVSFGSAALASVLLARSLARPLRRMADAARSFGEGDLTARAGLRRRDELGEVSSAFDEMADRVAGAIRAQKELLANVSHELRTPLARIRVALDLAAEGDAEMARSSLSEIGEDLAELERLVEDVMQTARFDIAARRSGTQAPPLRVERVEAHSVAQRASVRFQSVAPGRALELELEAPGAHVDADPDLLRRVLDNLLDNARKYAPPEEPIALRVELHEAPGEAPCVLFVVRDRGIGIADEDLALVGTPFFRTDRSRARATGGLGLGLSLARRVVEAHGGTLAVASARGEGTEVTVRLPVAQSDH